MTFVCHSRESGHPIKTKYVDSPIKSENDKKMNLSEFEGLNIQQLWDFLWNGMSNVDGLLPKSTF